jgi:uncharacterized protein (DUF433 family)
MRDASIEERDGGYYVAGTRVSLDSLVRMFRNGQSPETIQDSFNVLTLSEVYRAIAFYLENQEVVDRYLTERSRQWQAAEVAATPLKDSNPELWSRIERARAPKHQ